MDYENRVASLHFDYEIVPSDCIADCAASGDVEPAVSYWVDELNVTVNRDRATRYLLGFGAWDQSELDAMTDRGIAMRILWLASGAFADGDDLVILE